MSVWEGQVGNEAVVLSQPCRSVCLAWLKVGHRHRRKPILVNIRLGMVGNCKVFKIML